MDRDKKLIFRVTESEMTTIKSLAKSRGLSMSDFCRSKIFDTKPGASNRVRKVVHVADPELIRQIGWIGNNLNQVARAANSGRFSVLVELAQIEQSLAIIAEHYTGAGND
jgi:hypothetical protein